MSNESVSVGIFMGSKSDLPIVEESAKILSNFGVSYDLNVLSAHRTPHEVVRKLEELENKGVKIFIAAAGMAAHLAGVIAAHTHKPVLGIPLGGGDMNGLDSLMSTVQMPKGIPVGTVAIGKDGAINAALYAASILGITDKKIRNSLLKLRIKQTKSVKKKPK